MADDRDKKLIAYCGLYYGDCINYKGEVAQLKNLRKIKKQGTKKFLTGKRYR